MAGLVATFEVHANGLLKVGNVGVSSYSFA